MNDYSLKQLSLAGLLASSGLAIAAEQSPFAGHDYQPRQKTSDCRILEFNCSTCGHMTDAEKWTRDNRLISDIETCEQQKRDEKNKSK